MTLDFDLPSDTTVEELKAQLASITGTPSDFLFIEGLPDGASPSVCLVYYIILAGRTHY